MEASINHNLNISLSGLSFFLITLLILFMSTSLQSAPGDILYENYFSTNGDVSNDWTRLSGSGNDFQASSSTFNSSPRSLRIRDESGGTSDNNLIDASSAASVDVSFWLRQGSPGDAPESGDDLEFYYMNSSSNWILLATYSGSDAAGTVYNETFTLPADALHNNLRFRFEMTDGSNNDHWYVDDFVVSESAVSVIFSCDDFESGLNSWTISTNGGTAGINSNTFNSASNSLYTRWGPVSVTSVSIDTTSLTTVEVTAWVQRGSDAFSEYPDSSENLVISYLDSNSVWVVLETFSGGDVAGEEFLRSYPLPATAIHNNFRLKIEQLSGSGSDYDYWHIDDVCVQEYVPPPPMVCDDFESGLIYWSISSNGGSAGISGATFNSSSNSLYTRWGEVSVTSSTVNTSTFGEVEIQAWIRRGDDSFSENPEGSENLELSYLNNSNNWVILETFTGGGDPGEIFDRTYNLPASAIHSDFQLRIEQVGGSGSNWDYWHVDDVCIQDNEPPPTSSCSVYFPDTIQGHDSGSSVEFRNNGQVISDPDNTLTMPSLNDNTSSGHNTCNTVDCSITSTTAPAFTLPTFLTTSETSDLYLNSGTATIGPGGTFNSTEFDNFLIEGSTNITFNTSANPYIIDNGAFYGSSRITFNPGTYWFNELEIYENSIITINGPVTIFVNGQSHHLDIEDNATINASGTAEDLAIVSYRQVHLKDNAIVNGVIYSADEVELRSNTRLRGAISAYDRVRIRDNGIVTSEDISNVQVGELCGGTTPTLDHIEITNDGSALTCADETLTIKACANSDCSLVATSDVEVTLTASGGASNWSSNPVTIPANSNSGVTVDLTHRTAETITLGASSIPAAANAVVCSPVGCNLTFSEAGFLLSLPNHTSCSTSELNIQAVRLSETGTTCAPAYTGNQSVNFSFQYANPVSGTIVPVLESTSMAAANIVQNRTVNFDGTASATLDFEYIDAGQLTITVADGGSNGLTSGNVNTIVTPAKLNVYTNDTNASCAGPDYGNCSAFKVAGIPGNTPSEFNLTVEGACADDTVTPNFQLNSIPLTSNLVAPSGGNNASLGVSSVDIASGGTITVSQTSSEVGAFSITATPPNYQGQAIPTTTSSTIGRFIPDRFIITDNTPRFANATCNFSYQDQAFEFSAGLHPVLTLIAVNSAGTTTQNYGGDGIANNDFWKLDSNLLTSRTYANQVAVFPGSLNATTLGSISVADEMDYDGMNTFAFPLDQLTYNKAGVIPDPSGGPSSDEPFEANATLNLTALSLTDSDGVFNDSDPASLDDGVADAYTSSAITGTNIRWGRWFIANAFGSELQALPMVAEAQYYDGSNFVINTDDTSASCSTFTAVTTTMSNYFGNLSSGETTLPSPIPDIVDGLVTLTLSAPGSGNDGSLLMTLTSPAWMLYDYDGDSTAENASGTATFGIFEGRQPVIIQRQSY